MAGFITGTQGRVRRAGKDIARLNSFELSMANMIETVTDMGSEGVEREYTGIVDVTGSVSGQYQLYDTSTGATGDTVISQQNTIVQESEAGSTVAKAEWRFIESSESMWVGSMLVSDWNKGNSAEGIQTFTATLQGDGRMSHYPSSST
jgi:hypothetical protein